MLDGKHGGVRVLAAFEHIDHLVDNAIAAGVDLELVVAEIANAS
jgi:hypothetical protein